MPIPGDMTLMSIFVLSVVVVIVLGALALVLYLRS